MITIILYNYVKVTNRKTFQNKIFPELNSKKKNNVTNHLIFTKFRNFAKLYVGNKTWVSQKRNRPILREMTFANYYANCCFFRAKLMRKERKILRKSFANGNPNFYRSHSWKQSIFNGYSKDVSWTLLIWKRLKRYGWELNMPLYKVRLKYWIIHENIHFAFFYTIIIQVSKLPTSFDYKIETVTNDKFMTLH